MATVLVLRIPYWRSFVIYIPDLHQILHDINSIFRRKIRPKIFEEIESGNDQLAIQLAKSKGLMKWRGEWGESPLVAAINHGRSELACSIIEMAGTAPNDGALATAAMRGDLRVVSALLKIGKNPDEPQKYDQTDNGWTPLMWAINRHHIAVMEALLAAGANVDVISDDNTTAAMCTRAGKPQDLEALEVLCRYKPNITIKDWRGRNLIREALDRERCSRMPEMRQLLERYYPDLDFNLLQ
jgi:hypothetical protein